jgi:branched-chain amino acid transport system substrate-binding protein
LRTFGRLGWQSAVGLIKGVRALRHRYVRALGVTATAALLLGAAACGGDDGDGDGGSGSGAATTVKIGFMGDLTGPNANIVIPPFQGATLAVDEYNAKNPETKIELVKYDSKGDGDTAKNLAQQAVQNDKVVGLIGPAFSGESTTAHPIFEEAGIPTVSPSATAVDLASQGWTFWHRVVANDGVQGPAAAKLLAQATTVKKIFVVEEGDEYSTGLSKAVQDQLKADGIEVSTDRIDSQASDYSSTVNKIRTFAPGAIFHAGYYSAASKMLKQLRDAGVTVPWMTGDGSLDNALATQAGQQQSENAIVSCPCLFATASDDPTVQTFTNNYKQKFNQDPAVYSTEGYDSATVFIKALEAGKTEPKDINDFLKTLSFKGLSKEIKFTDTGEISASLIYIYQIKSGTLTLLGDANTAKVN